MTPQTPAAPRGLLEAATPAKTPPTTPAAPRQDLINQSIAGVEAKVGQLPEELQAAYLSIVEAGKAVMLSEQTLPRTVRALNEITSPAEVPQKVAAAVLQVIREVHAESQGKFSIPAGALATITLYLVALELVQSKKKIPITNALIDDTHALAMKGYNGLFGITGAKQKMAIEAGRAGLPQSGMPPPPAAAPPPAPRPGPPSPGATPGRL